MIDENTEPDFSDGGGDYDTPYSDARFQFTHLPSLKRRIRGSTGYFFIDTEKGQLSCIVELPDGRMGNVDINTCFKKGYKHVAPVLELIPGGKKDE